MAQFTFDGLKKFMSKEMEDDVSILVLKYQTAAEFYDDVEPSDITPDGEINTEGLSDEASEVTETDNSSFDLPEETNIEAFADEEISQEDLIRMAQEQAEEQEKKLEDTALPDDLPEDMDFSNFDDMFKN